MIHKFDQTQLMVRCGPGTFMRWNITTAPVVFIAAGYIGVFSLAVARQVCINAIID